MTAGRYIYSMIPPGAGTSGICFTGRSFWMLAFATATLSQVDIVSAHVSRSIVLDGGAANRAVCTDGRSLFVTALTPEIKQYDIRSGNKVRSIPYGFTNPVGMFITGRSIFVSDAVAKAIIQIDVKTGTTIRSFATPGTLPRGIAFDGRNIYMVDTTGAIIYVIDIKTGHTIRSFSVVNAGVFGLTYDGYHLVLSNVTLNNISKINVS